ncbi:MAG: hypothetical protein V2I35_01225 [Desulfocapsaceae bacterium]|jgi:hypothetical protein|nr:hypothetical protein [Desulfocapsaceae bacterium]
MYLLYGVLFVSVAVLSFAVLLIGCRNPQRPFWAGEGVVANVFLPLAIGLLIMGSINVLQSLFMYGPSVAEIGYSVLVLVSAVGAYLMLNVRRHLAHFAAQERSAVILDGDFKKNNQENQPEPPVDAPLGYRKAA